MTAFTNVVINDGKTTPVAHTFKTKSNDNRTTVWEDRVAGIPIGFPRMVLSTQDTDVIRKVTLGFSIPTLEAVAGANAAGFTPPQKVAYVHRCELVFKLPQRGTEQERKDLLAYVKNFLSNTAIAGDVIVLGDEISG